MTTDRAGAPVLVGIDGSPSSLRAARWAAREAVRRGTGLRLVHAFGPMPVIAPDRLDVGLPSDGDHRGHLLARARDDLDAAAVAAVAEAPGLRVDSEVLPDFPITCLVAESRHAELVVIGDRGRGGVAGVFLGSVAVALAARAACPVVVVRGDREPDATDPVVVGVDGSSVSDAAVAFAFEAAAARGAGLVAVHTWENVLSDELVVGIELKTVLDAERRHLVEVLAPHRARFPGVAVRMQVRMGRPDRALCAAAERAQLVVVGSRGRGAFAGLFGSVSHALLHRCPCPVVVVRPSLSVALHQVSG
ncbi:universal stress protein [Pseudonocardia sp. CA-107938]|uniref:universal stress protein n=1 Tax=Pseudonocardia sp. CA-107938 TaxID=3240021 RepID=UPI003D8CA2BB